MMFDRWDARLTRWRRKWSRGEWIASLLGPADEQLSGSEPGLVLVQIDGFSRQELERALEQNRMPFLRRLLQSEGYRLHNLYSGLPSTTFAVQAELFYGLKTAVPAVGFRIRRTCEVNMILDPPDAEQREAEIAARNGPGLLEGGSAYADALHGGAAEPHFCAAALTLRSILARIRPRLWPVLAVLYFPTLARIAWDTSVATCDALADAVRGVQRGHKLKHEFKFVLNRVVVDVVLRQWQTFSAQIDALRGLPMIHLNFLAFDEKAHRRGPKTRFAHRALRGVDRSLRKLWRAAGRSGRRDYELWIYADHGQEQVAPYPEKFGRPIEEAVRPLIDRLLPAPLSGEEEAPFTMAAIGPVGYIYPRQPLDDHQCAELAAAFVDEAGVPAVLYVDSQDRVQFHRAGGQVGALPEQATALLGEDHPFLNEAPQDLVAMCRHPEAGRLVLLGWCAGVEPISFAYENGAHGGCGHAETGAFALLPADVPTPDRGYFRPLDLRAAVLRRREGATFPRAGNALAEKHTSQSESTPPARKTLRVVTYNVHSCVGADGKISPLRIARVIAQCDPDVVALQELDVRRKRTLSRNQAEEIATILNMEFQFHPVIRLEEEQYGDAILTRLPMRLVRSGILPSATSTRRAEPRGALWVAAMYGDQEVQILNTHLGLDERERQEQIRALLGPEWLGHPTCREPVILCGDFNCRPRSRSFRILAEQLRDVQQDAPRRAPTFPSRWPVLRIDHIFVKGEIEVLHVEAPRTSLAVRASDHLPLVAELRIGPPLPQDAALANVDHEEQASTPNR